MVLRIKAAEVNNVLARILPGFPGYAGPVCIYPNRQILALGDYNDERATLRISDFAKACTKEEAKKLIAWAKDGFQKVHDTRLDQQRCWYGAFISTGLPEECEMKGYMVFLNILEEQHGFKKTDLNRTSVEIRRSLQPVLVQDAIDLVKLY